MGKRKTKKIAIKLIRKIIKATLPLKSRLHFYWRTECLRQATSSVNNIIRDKNSEKTAKEFNSYLQQPDIKDKLNNLKKRLNQNSQAEIDKFITRQKYIYTHNLMEQDKLFTKEEIEEQQICAQEEKTINKKLKKYKFKHFSIEAFYGLNGLRWLPEAEKNKLIKGLFIDIGAYDGDSAVSLLDFNPQTIYAFEPELYNFQKLQRNSSATPNNLIIPIKKGLSDHEFKAHITNQDVMSKINNTKKGEEIEITTLDNFIKEKNVPQVNLIKIDVEGEEQKVLQGAINTIKKYKPILTISIYHNPQDFFEIKPWLESIQPEYKFIIKKAKPFSLNHELMLLAYV